MGGVPVAMKDLTCEGGEFQVQDCQWGSPDAGCSDHILDAVVYCGTDGTAGIINEGSLRILSHDGAPSIDGEGRLEIFKAGGWAPVCNTGFTAGAEMVACKSMGFDGVKPSSVPAMCNTFKGKNYCGAVPPYVSKVSCAGQETSFQSCSFEEGDDVFCAPEESAIVRCTGEGETQGQPAQVPEA